jgi:hypothetical protein
VKINDLFRSKKSLAAADLVGKAVRVTIESVEVQKFDEGEKPVLHFVGKDKTMVLNKTNALRIIEAVGDDESDNWVGWSIVLYPTKVDYAGKRVDAIRIDDRPGATKKPTSAPTRPTARPEPSEEAFEDGGAMPDDSDIPFARMPSY